MLKRGFIVAAAALAAATGPAAMAAAPKCLNKANKYVACTDKLKAKPSKSIKASCVSGNGQVSCACGNRGCKATQTGCSCLTQ